LALGKIKFETTVDVPRNPAWNVAQSKVGVQVQDPDTGRILGVEEIAYPASEKGAENCRFARSVTFLAAAILIPGGNQRPPS
jgi:hypothetical protein